MLADAGIFYVILKTFNLLPNLYQLCSRTARHGQPKFKRPLVGVFVLNIYDVYAIMRSEFKWEFDSGS